MNTINFPNIKKSTIKDSKLEISDFKEILKTLFEQVNFACNCYHIGDRLDANLSNRYEHLENKWYIFALNSLDDGLALLKLAE